MRKEPITNHPATRSEIARLYQVDRRTIRRWMQGNPSLKEIEHYKRISHADWQLFLREIGPPPDDDPGD